LTIPPPGNEPTLRVLILGSDPLAREGLAARIASERDLEVKGQISGDEDLPQALASSRPDVLLWDLGTGDVGASGLDPRGFPTLPVLGSVADEAAAAEALGAGARGVLLRDAPPARLAAALRSIASGLIVIDEPLAGALLRLAGPGSARDTLELTRRELEVLQHLALGLPNREIAERLFISERTAKFHVNAILSKLGARSRTEAVVRAARAGLVAL
jgi:DNA-binding NarL/FixJ family response regulator